MEDKTLSILKDLKADIKNAEPFHDKWIGKQNQWIKEYNGEPYGNENNKSTVVSREIKKSSVWQVSQMVTPFVSNNNMVRVNEGSFEDDAIAQQSVDILNYQWSRDFDRYNFVKSSFDIQQREGTVVAKVSWEYEEQEMDVEEPIIGMVPVTDPNIAQQMVQAGQAPMQEGIIGYETVKKTIPIYNRPTAELLNNAFVYFDPTVEGNATTGQFIAIKYSSNISKLNENKSIYKNLDKVKDMVQSELYKTESNYDNDNGDFKFLDKARREFEVVEYWGRYDLDGDGIAEPIVAVWVGDICIRMEDNPYPDKETPFVVSTTDNEPFSPYGKPNADMIGVDQKIETGIKRSILNTLDASTNGQKGIPNGALTPLNKRKFMDGEDFEYNADAGPIWTGSYNQLPGDLFNFSESVKRNVQELTGVRPFGIGNTSMGSATEAKGALDAVASREIDLTRNYANNFIIPILRKWNSMNNAFLEDEEIFRITNKEVVRSKNDFRSNLDISIEVETAQTKSAKVNDIAFMIQTMGPSLPFELNKILLSEIAELKDMKSLKNKIESYEPQVDPLEQKAKELEVQKLESEILERQSRAEENKVDMDLKSAKADNERAKTRGAHAKADLDDQAFVSNADGSKQSEAIEMENIKARNKSILNEQQSLNATK